ncbi:MAG: amidohydrolase family protein [Geodermatophilaceae bacterium]|nr:amidohydrolase family protein [Geodermatophilaceae bacterium]
MSAGRPSPALHVRGVVLPEGETHDIWIRDGLISFESVPGAETVATDCWLVPGLVDAHNHIGLDPSGPVIDVAVQREQALADRDAGALLIRDCGVPVDTRHLDEHLDLPRIIRAGRHLAPRGRYIPHVAVELDDPAALPDAAIEQARAGDGWVKLVGDWIERGAGDLAPCWPPDAVFAAIDAAHRAGARVTAHVFGTEALPDLIAAGIDCIEHGTGLSTELIDELAARRTALVPTLINIDNFPSFADAGEAKFPAYAARMRRLHAGVGDMVAAAYEAGVPIYAGTDAGGSLSHGLIAEEIAALASAGMPAVDALAAGSWAARSWLGLPGIEEGAPADLVVYDADPRLDLSVLRRPAWIILRGNVLA